MKAFVFAAGLGTRLYPLTATCPKALVPVAGRPMLERLIERLRDSGITAIVINVHHFAGQIKDFVAARDWGVPIYISDESRCLLDTGGGLKNARQFFSLGEDFLAHNVDIYSEVDLRAMCAYHVRQKALCTMAVRHRHSSRQLLFDTANRLCGRRSLTDGKEVLVGAPQVCNALAFSGIYCFNYAIFDKLAAERRFAIMPELLRLAATEKIIAYQHDEAAVVDLGKTAALAEFERSFAKKDI